MTSLPISPTDAILVVLLLTAVYTDLTTQRIPNALTFGVMALGIAVNIAAISWWWGLAGVLVAFVMMFPGYAFFGAVKAGDAKLLMAVGALLGWENAVEACLLTYILNLPFGIAVLAYKGRLGNFVKVLKATANRTPAEEAPEATVVAFAPVIAVATIIARLMELTPW